MAGLCQGKSLPVPTSPQRLAALTFPDKCGAALLILCTSWQAVGFLGCEKSVSNG